MSELPAEIPVTTPFASTVATDASELDQSPPDATSDKVVVEPVHTVAVPVMASTDGIPFTVIVSEAVCAQPFPLITL